mmetsp:Transcript_760/g.2192  ORF Transcript_760/g.2192 Transcript_760/m.2192 type:complete len:396 (-) Transcript_760:573-1760(-)
MPVRGGGARRPGDCGGRVRQRRPVGLCGLTDLCDSDGLAVSARHRSVRRPSCSGAVQWAFVAVDCNPALRRHGDVDRRKRRTKHAVHQRRHRHGAGAQLCGHQRAPGRAGQRSQGRRCAHGWPVVCAARSRSRGASCTGRRALRRLCWGQHPPGRARGDRRQGIKRLCGRILSAARLDRGRRGSDRLHLGRRRRRHECPFAAWRFRGPDGRLQRRPQYGVAARGGRPVHGDPGPGGGPLVRRHPGGPLCKVRSGVRLDRRRDGLRPRRRLVARRHHGGNRDHCRAPDRGGDPVGPLLLHGEHLRQLRGGRWHNNHRDGHRRRCRRRRRPPHHGDHRNSGGRGGCGPRGLRGDPPQERWHGLPGRGPQHGVFKPHVRATAEGVGQPAVRRHRRGLP